ncbi:MAG: hypothetical protein IT371_19740 [Deltaproteobacteria bacterium]|nr:hypothetical protein [Deltaproteobacteria bacterium]
MSKISLALLVGVLASACKANGNPGADAGSSNTDVRQALSEGSPVSGDGRPGPYVTADLWVAHLSSNHAPDEKLLVHLWPSGGITDADAFARFSSVTTVAARNSKGLVPGSWKVRAARSGRVEVEFSADPSFTVDQDYVLTVRKDGVIAPSREVTLFHVGSLPRVRRICFGTVQAGVGSSIDAVSVKYSEVVLASTVTLQASRRSGGSWMPLGAPVPQTKEGETLESRFVLAASLDPGVAVKLTLPAALEAPTGKKLDGKYTGQSGSGPLEVELLPGKYFRKNYESECWEPPLAL